MLLAAREHRLRRVVYMSSAQVFGTAEGERLPDYLPVDDAHPLLAQRPYGLSKRLAEDLFQAITATDGISTVCLRPVAVWGPAEYASIVRRRALDTDAEWTPFWEYGAFIESVMSPPPSAPPCSAGITGTLG